MNTDADKPAMIKFWSEHSGWDTLDEEQWDHRFTKTPMGPAAFSLAVDQESKEIVGQSAFIPCRVTVEGSEFRSYRPFGAIINTKGIRRISA